MLVVDDCELSLQMARCVLQAEGAQVQIASGGEQALAWLAAPGGRVDLVLLDLQMPGMDGFETARRLRQLPGLTQPTVLALSADDPAEQCLRARAAGMDGCVAKPLDPVRLRAALAGLAMPTPPVAAPRAIALMPSQGIALPQALAVWQDLATYRHYLTLFLREHGPQLAAHVGRLSGPEAAPWLHRLRGVAGGLSLPALAQAAAQLEKTLATDPERRAAGWQDLHEAWAEVLDAQARLEPAAPELASKSQSASRLTAARAPACPAPLRERLLQALDRDNPDAVLPLLPELTGHLGVAELARLQRCVEDFDFRAAERLVREAWAGEAQVARAPGEPG